VVVVGLGVVGGATAMHLARAGADVVGVDRFDPPHRLGSSHGETRITRLAVGEGAEYAPLVRRSHELWQELEAETGEQCYVPCGGLILGAPGSTGQHGVDHFAAATIDVATRHGIDHEVLAADEIRSRFPVLAATDEVGYFEPEAGYLRAEVCVAAQLATAGRHGARLRTHERALAVTERGGAVHVQTPSDTIVAARAVLSIGPWVGELAPTLADRCTVHREVQYWFALEPDADVAAYERLPVFIWLHGSGPGALCYGFPAIGGADRGVKVATETFDAATTPDRVDRAVTDAEAAAMHREHLRGRLLGLSARCLRAETCLYTVTADFGFVVDTLPGSAHVIVVSACSGHGFKHAPAVGECAAALALGLAPAVDLAPFSLARLAARGAAGSP
jgi:sarcosine oxidase